MAERLRVWLTGGHECDLDRGEGSAQDLMEKVLPSVYGLHLKMQAYNLI